MFFIKFITKKYLRDNPNHIFVFGDNLDRKGKGGAAILRDEPNTYGFITKKKPTTSLNDYFTPDEYKSIYKSEMKNLKNKIIKNSDKLYLISKIGAGLANKFGIFEKIIKLNIKNDLKGIKNIKFLW